jgi:4-amino-4-deoxy-L-arabinose transferase-like glycosyltransferase
MGNEREMRMWDWLETHRPEAEKRYVEYIRSIVNSPDFYSGEYLDNFFEWCMENWDKPSVA